MAWSDLSGWQQGLVIVAVLVALGGLATGLYFLIKHLTKKKGSDGTLTGQVAGAAVAMKATNLGAARLPGRALKATKVTVHADCAVPTGTTLCGQAVTANHRVCSISAPDTYFDDRYVDSTGQTQYYSYVKDCDGGDGTWRVVFGPRGATDWVRPLKNVSGEFFSMMVTPAADQYQTGFDPGEGLVVTQALFDTMYTKLDSEGVVLVGAHGALTAGAAKYGFNALTPVSHPVRTLTAAELSRLVKVDGANTKGCLRFAAEYVDYEFDVPNAAGSRTCRLRLYINHRYVPMSTKAWGEYNDASGDWEYRLLDITDITVAPPTGDAAPQVTGQTLTEIYSGSSDPPEAWFVSGRTYLSFWNNYLIWGQMDQSEPQQSAANEAANAAIYETNFKAKVTPMPIALIEDSVDLGLFVSGAVELDLVINSSISFSRLKSGDFAGLGASTADAALGDWLLASMTSAATGAQVGAAIMQYEMQDLSFRARVSSA